MPSQESPFRRDQSSFFDEREFIKNPDGTISRNPDVAPLLPGGGGEIFGPDVPFEKPRPVKGDGKVPTKPGGDPPIFGPPEPVTPPGGGTPPPPVDTGFPDDGAFRPPIIPPPTDPQTGFPVRPTGYGDPSQDPFILDTEGSPIRDVPDFPYFLGDEGPNLTTQNPTGEGITRINPDGSITPGAVDPTTREVQPEELVANQLSGLLASDSKFIQDARRQGLEQANALGGLGGTVGAGASMQAAIRAGLPIAQADAQAFALAASQNMEALNQFANLNLQRVSQLELAQIDSRTRTQITQIGTSAQMAAAKLASATQRDISFVDNETKLRITEMSGQIQDRLARFQFEYNSLLADQEAANQFGNTALTGEYALENADRIRDQQTEMAYMELVSNGWTAYMDQLAALNGVEMDGEARTRANGTITQGAKNYFNLINSMFPTRDPIRFGRDLNPFGNQE